MPGHNHYPWCSCGWCYRTRSGAYSRSYQPITGHRINNPLSLAAYNVSEKRSVACFVNPNANCLVCGERVYFYQNAHGSRVYFDDLGWPWPKHPCTDNSQSRTGTRGPAVLPNDLRDQQTSEDLLRAARHENIVFKRTIDSDGWMLCSIVKVGIFDNKSDVDVSFLEEDRPLGRFRYEGTSPFLTQKSIIAYKGDQVSLPDAETLERTIIPVRWLR